MSVHCPSCRSQRPIDPSFQRSFSPIMAGGYPETDTSLWMSPSVHSHARTGIGPVVAIAAVMLLSISSCGLMIEPDKEPERRAWKEVCAAPGVSLAPVQSSPDIPAEGVQRWWAHQSGDYVWLRAADCSTTKIELPQPTVAPDGRVNFTTGVRYSTVHGVALVEKLETGAGARTLWFLPVGGVVKSIIGVEGSVDGAILSDTADAIGWIELIDHPTDRATSRLRI